MSNENKTPDTDPKSGAEVIRFPDIYDSRRVDLDPDPDTTDDTKFPDDLSGEEYDFDSRDQKPTPESGGAGITRREFLVGAGAVATTAAALVGGIVGLRRFLENDAREDQAREDERKEQQAADDAKDRLRDERAEQQRLQETAMFLQNFQEALSGGTVQIDPRVLIINQGVRIRRDPIKNGYAEGSPRVGVTDSVWAITGALIFDGNIIIPSEEKPLLDDAGNLNPESFTFISSSVIGSTVDTASDTLWAEWVGNPSDAKYANGKVAFNKTYISLTSPEGEQAISSITKFTTPLEAKRWSQ